jgi:NADPH:quinone reductase-like Zn-dependent oxidoreductase
VAAGASEGILTQPTEHDMHAETPARWAMRPLRTALALALLVTASASHAADCAEIPGTMRAIQLVDYGGAEQLKPVTIPVLAPKAGEVLVEVHAASVNPIDWKLREGQGKGWWPLELPAILGRDVAGVVVATGAGVEGWQCGDEVVAFLGSAPHGGYAEYVPVDVGSLARKPGSLTFTEAGAYPLVAMTAWQATVDAGGVKAGDRVLVHGGAGGVGGMAVQIAKARGAHVIATASARNHEYLTSIGADEAIDYRTQRFEDVVKDVDLVVDTVGGDTLERSPAVVKRGGRIVSVAGRVPQAACDAGGIECKGVRAVPAGESLAEIGRLIDAGKIKVHVDATFPLARAADAQELNREGHTRGKIVLVVRGDAK